MLTANLAAPTRHTPGMSESTGVASESRGYATHAAHPAISPRSSTPAAPNSLPLSPLPPFPSSPPHSTSALGTHHSALAPHPDPSLLSLKSAAFTALAEIFAAKDADYREKRLAASIVFKYAATIESRAGSPTVRKGSSASPSPAAITDELSTDPDPTDLKAPARTHPISSPSVPSVLFVPSPSRPPSKTKSSPPPPPQPDPIPPDWLNQLRDDEVKLSPFAALDTRIPRHITDNHHVQHLQRLCYNHGYWTGFHNYKGTQRPPYPATFASGTAESAACNPKTPLGIIRPALLNASAAADLIARAGTTHPP